MTTPLVVPAALLASQEAAKIVARAHDVLKMIEDTVEEAAARDDLKMVEVTVEEAAARDHPSPTRCGCMIGPQQCRRAAVVMSEPARCDDCNLGTSGAYCLCVCGSCVAREDRQRTDADLDTWWLDDLTLALAGFAANGVRLGVRRQSSLGGANVLQHDVAADVLQHGADNSIFQHGALDAFQHDAARQPLHEQIPLDGARSR